jgi:hypothetical protein
LLNGRVSIRWIHKNEIITSSAGTVLEIPCDWHTMYVSLITKAGMSQIFADDMTDMGILFNEIGTGGPSR